MVAIGQQGFPGSRTTGFTKPLDRVQKVKHTALGPGAAALRSGDSSPGHWTSRDVQDCVGV